eukprot:TRINITY_DN84710_c0_g1_i1.p1 TRINITY_DN84710_c0_g1~~TRINITY_DN84710_c0_g1_i1.p1  ORF type:complete len:107 (+),score=3.06 TRINITY_DN84710_c0_g1_i1:13-333(+)
MKGRAERPNTLVQLANPINTPTNYKHNLVAAKPVFTYNVPFFNFGVAHFCITHINLHYFFFHTPSPPSLMQYQEIKSKLRTRIKRTSCASVQQNSYTNSMRELLRK